MDQSKTSAGAGIDTSSRRRRLRRVKNLIDLVPSSRIAELEDFVWTLLPEPLTEELEPTEDLRELVRGWTVPENLGEIDRLDDRELNRLLLVAWIMQQPPEDQSRDWDAVHSSVREAIRRRRSAGGTKAIASEDMAEQLLELWNAITRETAPAPAPSEEAERG